MTMTELMIFIIFASSSKRHIQQTPPQKNTYPKPVENCSSIRTFCISIFLFRIFSSVMFPFRKSPDRIFRKILLMKYLLFFSPWQTYRPTLVFSALPSIPTSVTPYIPTVALRCTVVSAVMKCHPIFSPFLMVPTSTC